MGKLWQCISKCNKIQFQCFWEQDIFQSPSIKATVGFYKVLVSITSIGYSICYPPAPVPLLQHCMSLWPIMKCVLLRLSSYCTCFYHSRVNMQKTPLPWWAVPQRLKLTPWFLATMQSSQSRWHWDHESVLILVFEAHHRADNQYHQPCQFNKGLWPHSCNLYTSAGSTDKTTFSFVILSTHNLSPKVPVEAKTPIVA